MSSTGAVQPRQEAAIKLSIKQMTEEVGVSEMVLSVIKIGHLIADRKMEETDMDNKTEDLDLCSG